MSNENTHILIVDDNEDILFMLQAMLRFKGYTVSIKSSIEDLENFVSDVSPQAILMDMLLCGADGREICKRLKTNVAFSSVPIIMISAHPQAKEACLEAGADYFLEKPFEITDLYKAVSDVTRAGQTFEGLILPEEPGSADLSQSGNTN